MHGAKGTIDTPFTRGVLPSSVFLSIVGHSVMRIAWRSWKAFASENPIAATWRLMAPGREYPRVMQQSRLTVLGDGETMTPVRCEHEFIAKIVAQGRLY